MAIFSSGCKKQFYERAPKTFIFATLPLKVFDFNTLPRDDMRYAQHVKAQVYDKVILNAFYIFLLIITVAKLFFVWNLLQRN